MRKSLLLLGVAVAALASCTQNEVLEVAEGRSIQFNTFVNNNTKAVTVDESASNFYVIGKYKPTAGGEWKDVFTNELGNTIHYWEASSSYEFGAYANGEAPIADTEVTFDADNKTMSFSNYIPNDANDLIVATASHAIATDLTTSNNIVNLTFKHMLSRVKFTFTTTDADAYTLKITDLVIGDATHKANGKYETTGDKITWTEVEKGGYAYDAAGEIDDVDIADKNINYTVSSEKFVIPQENTNNLKVTFTATFSGLGQSEITKNFEATLGFTAPDPDNGTANNAWTPGFIYNYTAEINGAMIDPNLQTQKIQFAVSVDPWKDANTDGTIITPTAQQ